VQVEAILDKDNFTLDAKAELFPFHVSFFVAKHHYFLLFSIHFSVERMNES
jgi:hypothetical protein